MENPTAYEDLGPTRPSTSSTRQTPRTQPSAAHKRLIGQLGLRYRPSGQADLQAHAGALALLTCDLADIPADYLDRAIRKWTLESKFIPKASELAAIAQDMVRKDAGKRDPHALCQHGNAHLAKIGRTDIHWIVIDGQAVLEPAYPSQPIGPTIQGKFTEAEIIASCKQQRAWHDAKRRGSPRE